MRSLIMIPVLLFTLACHASAQSGAKSDWALVQSLPLGTHIHVSAKHGSTSCFLSAVDAESLTCKHGAPKPDSKFLRTEVKSITRPRGGRSALIGLVVGGGAGAGIGAAATKSGSLGGKPLGAIFYGLLAGVAGAILGGVTDFMHTTIYRAP